MASFNDEFHYFVMTLRICLQMLLVQPTEEMSKFIQVELNENPATREKDVEAIKEWLIKQPHLPQFDGTRVCLLSY